MHDLLFHFWDLFVPLLLCWILYWERFRSFPETICQCKAYIVSAKNSGLLAMNDDQTAHSLVRRQRIVLLLAGVQPYFLIFLEVAALQKMFFFKADFDRREEEPQTHGQQSTEQDMRRMRGNDCVKGRSTRNVHKLISKHPHKTWNTQEFEAHKNQNKNTTL